MIGAAGTPAASSAATSASRFHAAKAPRQQRRQVGIGADAGGVGREAWGAREAGVADHLAQPCELAVIADREHEMSVGRGKHVLRLDVGMTVAAALRRFAGDEMVHRLVGEERRRDIEHGKVDGLALPRLGAPRECGENGDRRVHACHQIDNGNADLLRAAAGLAVALAGHAHQAAHGLDGEVVRGVLASSGRPGRNR